jgi:hypothetical protein
MFLSPFTNYTIRRMLQDYADSLKGDAHGSSRSQVLLVSESVSLEQLLMRLYPKKFAAIAKIHHLEMLTTLYRQTFDRAGKNAYRHKILQVLGLRVGGEAEPIPPIVPEEEGIIFKFFWGKNLWDGMTLDGKIYGKVESVDLSKRTYLYEVALAFLEQNIACVLTNSQDGYSLWVPLRSPLYNVYLKQGITPVRKALALNAKLAQFKSSKMVG